MAVVVRILLAQPRVDCNAKDKNEGTPLMHAVAGAFLPEILGAKVLQCVRVLAGDHRVELDTADNVGRTAKDMARLEESRDKK
jgi:hypothetical protein